MVKNTKKPGEWDCGTCQGRHHKCLLAGKAVSVAVPGRPSLGRRDVCSVKDMPAVVAWARGDREVPDFTILRWLGVCPIPLFTPLSVECLNLYRHGQATNTFSIVAGQYYDQPAFYMAAMNLIAAEEGRIRAEKVVPDE